jgi:hypothetical protein
MLLRRRPVVWHKHMLLEKKRKFSNAASFKTDDRIRLCAIFSPIAHYNEQAHQHDTYCHDFRVTIDEFWIDDRIYWTLWYSAWLHFTIHRYTHNSIHSYVFISRCSVAAFNGRRSPSSGFPNYPRPQLPASHSNSSQRLNLSSSLIEQLYPSPTNSLH